MRYSLDGLPTLLSGYELFRQVDDLKNIVYNRFLTRPDIQSSGRVNTLPDDSIAAAFPMQLGSIQGEQGPLSTFRWREM